MGKFFYSASTGGFYTLEIHGAMPDDATEITAEYHQQLLTEQSAGRQITADDNGYPITIETEVEDGLDQ